MWVAVSLQLSFNLPRPAARLSMVFTTQTIQ